MAGVPDKARLDQKIGVQVEQLGRALVELAAVKQWVDDLGADPVTVLVSDYGYTQSEAEAVKFGLDQADYLHKVALGDPTAQTNLSNETNPLDFFFFLRRFAGVDGVGLSA